MIVLLGAKSKLRPENLTIPVPNFDNMSEQKLNVESNSLETDKDSNCGEKIKADFCDQAYDCLKDHFCSQLPK